MTHHKISIEQVDQLLPQTQCQECSYQDCRSYAEAIVNEDERISRCAPGGLETLHALATLLDKAPAPHHQQEVTAQYRPPSKVKIREELCIGCTKCIQACPVDAIMGSAKWMHTVIATECTGCNLCIEPCPMDCIDVIPLQEMPSTTDKTHLAQQAKMRYQTRQQRLEKKSIAATAQHQQAKQARPENSHGSAQAARQAYIAEALQRAKNKPKE